MNDTIPIVDTRRVRAWNRKWTHTFTITADCMHREIAAQKFQAKHPNVTRTAIKTEYID